MRFIDWTNVSLPKEWLAKAQKATADLDGCTTVDERKTILESESAIWRDPDLKEIMERLSFEKCWYCEAVQDRSDYAVDHFRPKNRVAKAKDHEGYWWLAFDWHNYRCSCTWCNSKRKDRPTNTSGGKQDEFPLLDSSTRAKPDNRDLSQERHVLLDPTCEDDPKLLWFNQDGSAIPRYSESENKEAFTRADSSIVLYHLNYRKTKRRRLELYHRIEKLVENGDKCLIALEENEDNEMALQWFGTTVDDLKQILLPSSEFSAAARAFVMGLREPSREWLDVVLEPDDNE
jgi:uncharacterized protein (TIGR02646 family)